MRTRPQNAHDARRRAAQGAALAVAVALTFSAGVSSSGAYGAHVNACVTRTATSAENGRTLLLNACDRLMIRLAEGSDGGYHWVFAAKPKLSILKLISNRSVPPTLPPGAVGGMNTRVVTFRARRHGDTKLKMLELGPGETRAKHSKRDSTFTLKIKVG